MVELPRELSDDAISSQTASDSASALQRTTRAVKATSARLQIVWDKCWTEVRYIMKEGSITQKIAIVSALSLGAVLLGGVSSFLLLTISTVVITSVVAAFLSLWAVTAVLAVLLATVGTVALGAITIGGGIITTVTCFLLALTFWASGVAFAAWAAWKAATLAFRISRDAAFAVLGALQGPHEGEAQRETYERHLANLHDGNEGDVTIDGTISGVKATDS